MLRFRPPNSHPPLNKRFNNPDDIIDILDELTRPEHLFCRAPYEVSWQSHVEEELVWEIFRGRLLDPAQTRETANFLAWNAYLRGDSPSTEPILAIKWDREAGQLHVVRGLECYVWEGYTDPDADNVYLSRQRRKWVCELVGTVELERFSNLETLRDELQGLLFHAVVGLSRLPLTSTEAPLPGFCFGQFLYVPRKAGQTLQTSLDLFHILDELPTPRERARVLEVFLRGVSAEDLRSLSASDLASVSGEVFTLLRRIYNEVSLSPWTQLVERTLDFTHHLHELGIATASAQVDFWSWLLRQMSRHLHAYDLVTFHHRGANYPDALLLDMVLKEYLHLLEAHPALAEGATPKARRRRRALRQGWLQRRRYEAHPVPDAPTSPGENNRVFPDDHPRVPEEQILNAQHRRKKLFADDPLSAHFNSTTSAILQASLDDLDDDDELLELGSALYLDRPLGHRKPPTEPDQTPLLASLAFSKAVARSSLDLLEMPNEERERLRHRLDGFAPQGVPLAKIGGVSKPGGVRLVDAHLASRDFVFLHTMPGSMRTLLELFDFQPLLQAYPFLRDVFAGTMFVTETPSGSLMIYDGVHHPRIEFDVQGDFTKRATIEYPVEGLRIFRV